MELDRSARSGVWFPVTLGAALLVLGSCSGFPDPSELPGHYENANAPARLELRNGLWLLRSGRLVKSGSFLISGNRVGLEITDVNDRAFDRYCRDRVDVYEWSVDDGRLTLRSIGDVCDSVGQAVLTAGPWERTDPR